LKLNAFASLQIDVVVELIDEAIGIVEIAGQNTFEEAGRCVVRAEAEGREGEVFQS
jgi:hypothetical protein